MGLHVDVLATLFAGREDYDSVDQSEECVVFADAYVKAGVVLCATLALEDVAGFAVASAEDFHAEAFAFRFAAVLRTADTFFMCHIFLR